jgi:electron transport complex protein RnfA
MTIQMILGIILTSILSENYALIECLGTGAVIENDRSTKRSLALGAGTTVVMLIATLITWPINKFVLGAKFEYLQTMVFVAVVLVIVEAMHLVARRLLDNYCHSHFVKFAVNGAVLGLCIHNTAHGFLEAIITAAAVGIGFMLTMTLYGKLKDLAVDEDAIPASFRGLPIALLTAGMIALALLALQFNVG